MNPTQFTVLPAKASWTPTGVRVHTILTFPTILTG